MRKVTLTAVLGACVLAACGSDESREDADDVLNGQVDKDSPYVSAFNNKYPNIEHKCLTEGTDGGESADTTGKGTGLRALVTSSERVIVIPDPHCPGYLPEQRGIAGVISAP